MTRPAGYDDLVTAATVGLDRRPLRLSDLAGPASAHAGVLDAADPAAALLDAAALLSSARRAGLQPAAAPVPDVAAPDTAPELSRAATAILADVLRSDPELAADLLTAAATAGFRAAPPVLPALLDAAVRHRALREPARAVLGQRGQWLAGYREDWGRALGIGGAGRPGEERIYETGRPGARPPGQFGVPAPGDTTPAVGPGAAEVWQTGARRDRRNWLAGLRHRDPAAARELLAEGWAQETGDDRSDLLAVLADRLSAADEPFLEAALDDRKQAVRQAAARLLGRLPDSAFTQRVTARGTATLSISGPGISGPGISGPGISGPGRRAGLFVTLPDGRDAAAARDGVPAAPAGAATGGRAWLLIQFIAGVPLAAWSTRLGLSPAQLTGLPVDGFEAEVHAGWRKAAVTQRDAGWAAALLAAGQGRDRQRASQHASQGARQPPGRGPAGPAGPAGRAESADTELAMVLPPAERVTWAQGILARCGPGPQAAAALNACPGPWPARLADAVLAQLARGIGAGHQHRNVLVILPLAARMLPATGDRDYAAALRALALAGPPAGELLRRLHRAADVVAYRRRYLQELQ